VQAEHFSSWQLAIAHDFGEVCCKGRGFKAGADGVAGLRVGKLEVENVAGLLANSGASQSNASWGECSQPRGE
jgi:hypothetical protein